MLPFVVAFVDLDEGFRILTHIIDCPPEDVQVGQPVEVAWIDAGEVSLPAFRPIAQTA
jgi:uncharacterized OB-fold protein